MERPTDPAPETSDRCSGPAEQLIDEGMRMERHPLVHFRTGGSGLRRPALVGTRLYVWQVIETVRAEGCDVAAAAEYFGLPERSVRAAIDYYADFTEEIDAYRAEEVAFAERERRRAERA
jgi:uncharacterized protein (DUF433 family)